MPTRRFFTMRNLKQFLVLYVVNTSTSNLCGYHWRTNPTESHVVFWFYITANVPPTKRFDTSLPRKEVWMLGSFRRVQMFLSNKLYSN